MKFNHFMSATSAIMLLLGLSFIFYGRWVLSFYAMSFEPSSRPRLVAGSSMQPLMVGLAFIRMFGVMILGAGLLAWLTRNLSDVEAQQAILLSFFLVNGLAFLMIVLQQITLWIYVPPLKTLSARVLAGLFLMLSVAFGYMRFIKEGLP